jgi:hypothetical protein
VDTATHRAAIIRFPNRSTACSDLVRWDSAASNNWTIASTDSAVPYKRNLVFWSLASDHLHWRCVGYRQFSHCPTAGRQLYVNRPTYWLLRVTGWLLSTMRHLLQLPVSRIRNCKTCLCSFSFLPIGQLWISFLSWTQRFLSWDTIIDHSTHRRSSEHLTTHLLLPCFDYNNQTLVNDMCISRLPLPFE